MSYPHRTVHYPAMEATLFRWGRQVLEIDRIESPEGYALTYRDGDFSAILKLQQILDERASNTVTKFSIDFSDAKEFDFTTSYGAWRRVLSFIITALPACFGHRSALKARRYDGNISIAGIWRNGFWQKDENLTLTLSPLIGQEEFDCEHFLFPLDGRPFEWRAQLYEPDFFHLSLSSGVEHSSGAQIAIPFTEAKTRLRQMPHFVAGDDEAYLYAVAGEPGFHRGEDWAPDPVYGFLNENFGISFLSDHWDGVQTLHNPLMTYPDDSKMAYFAPRKSASAGSKNMEKYFSYLEQDVTFQLPGEEAFQEIFYAIIDTSAVGKKWDASNDGPDHSLRLPSADEYQRQRHPTEHPDQNWIRFGSYLGKHTSGFPHHSTWLRFHLSDTRSATAAPPQANTPEINSESTRILPPSLFKRLKRLFHKP